MKIGEKLLGIRLYLMRDDWSDLEEGCYCQLPNGDWAIHPPGSPYGTLSKDVHRIEEHEDGAITVSPSILSHGWHGYLKHGVWERVQ